MVGSLIVIQLRTLSPSLSKRVVPSRTRWSTQSRRAKPPIRDSQAGSSRWNIVSHGWMPAARRLSTRRS